MFNGSLSADAENMKLFYLLNLEKSSLTVMMITLFERQRFPLGL